MKPSVEILLATHNGELFLREQIDSILAQSSSDWHLTISDDASTDQTPAIIHEYCIGFPDKITSVRTGLHFGNARDHFFHLMRTCTAHYMFFCDQDDVWYADKVEKLMRVMLEEERRMGAATPLLVFCDQVPTDQRLHPLAHSLMAYQAQHAQTIDYRALLMQNIVTGGAMVINRALADLAGECCAPAQTMMHDWWIAVTAARFGSVIYVNEPLGIYRQHGQNSVGATNARSFHFLWKNLLRIRELRRIIGQKKVQAAVFASTYRDRLSTEDDAFLSAFIKARSGPLFYLRYRRFIHSLPRLAAMLFLG